MSRFIPMVGKKLGRLLVVAEAGDDHCGNRRLECLCDCGRRTIQHRGAIVSGRVVSCGCHKRERATKHGGARDGAERTAEYSAWQAMKRRCTAVGNNAFENYGGRGIKVHAPWLVSFEIFLRDVGTKPSAKHTLERIDNDGNYEPKNVRWATRKEQARNKRSVKLYSANGRSLCLTDWAEVTGVSTYRLKKFLAQGETIEQALAHSPSATPLYEYAGETLTLEEMVARTGKSHHALRSEKVNVTAFGQTRTVAEWAKTSRLSQTAIWRRLRSGWWPKSFAVTAPLLTRMKEGQ